MLEDVYASSDVNIVMMMFFELFYSEKFLRLTGDQKVVGSSSRLGTQKFF